MLPLQQVPTFPIFPVSSCELKKTLETLKAYLTGNIMPDSGSQVYSHPYFPNNQQISTGFHTPKEVVGTTEVLKCFCPLHPFYFSSYRSSSPPLFHLTLWFCICLMKVFGLYCVSRIFFFYFSFLCTVPGHMSEKPPETVNFAVHVDHSCYLIF